MGMDIWSLRPDPATERPIYIRRGIHGFALFRDALGIAAPETDAIFEVELANDYWGNENGGPRPGQCRRLAEGIKRAAKDGKLAEAFGKALRKQFYEGKPEYGTWASNLQCPDESSTDAYASQLTVDALELAVWFERAARLGGAKIM